MLQKKGMIHEESSLVWLSTALPCNTRRTMTQQLQSRNTRWYNACLIRAMYTQAVKAHNCHASCHNPTDTKIDLVRNNMFDQSKKVPEGTNTVVGPTNGERKHTLKPEYMRQLREK